MPCLTNGGIIQSCCLIISVIQNYTLRVLRGPFRVSAEHHGHSGMGPEAQLLDDAAPAGACLFSPVSDVADNSDFFTLRGAWYVLGFTVLELSAVGSAFLLYARHATDRERIAMMENCLLIEVVQAEQVRQIRLDPRFTRVEPPASRGALVRLEANGTSVEVGRFLGEWKRRELAQDLKRALAYGLQNSNLGF